MYCFVFVFVFPFYFPLPTSRTFIYQTKKWNSWKSHFEKVEVEWQLPLMKDRIELVNQWRSGDRENR